MGFLKKKKQEGYYIGYERYDAAEALENITKWMLGKMIDYSAIVSGSVNNNSQELRNLHSTPYWMIWTKGTTDKIVDIYERIMSNIKNESGSVIFKEAIEKKRDLDSKVVEKIGKDNKDELVELFIELVNSYERKFDYAVPKDPRFFGDEADFFLVARDEIHYIYSFLKDNYNWKIDEETEKELRRVDEKVLEYARTNKLLNYDPFSNFVPNKYWWYHLDKVDKLSKADMDQL